MRATQVVMATTSMAVLLICGVALAGCGAMGGPEEASKPKPELTTVAGGGDLHLGDGGPATKAGFCGPTDVALDAAGNMYISDTGTIAAVPAATPFARWILMGPSRPWRAPESPVSPAMAGQPPRPNSMSPSPWRWTR